MLRRSFLKLCAGFAAIATMMYETARATEVCCEKQRVCKWTLKPVFSHSQDCRYIAWEDTDGNLHYALSDKFPKYHERWFVRPPQGQMHFGRMPEGEFNFHPATKRYPGCDYGRNGVVDEGKFVTPEWLDSLKAPEDFESLWNAAKKIEDCTENCMVIGHYLHHR